MLEMRKLLGWSRSNVPGGQFKNCSMESWGSRFATRGLNDCIRCLFPFADGLIAAAEAGATAAIQPGGSVRDDEAIEAADERNMAMIFT